MPIAYWDETEIIEAEPVAEPVEQQPAQTVVITAPQSAIANPRATRLGSRIVPTAAPVTGRAAPSRVVATRNAVLTPTNTAAGAVISRAAAPSQRAARTAGTNPAVAARAALIQTDTVNKPLYIPANTNTAGAARVGMSNNIVARMPTSAVPTAGGGVSAAQTAAVQLDEFAQFADMCKSQFYSCMDNYCAVLDDDQGRCSCSSDIRKYQDIERSLKDITLGLQDVAQRIQLLGLTGDEITSVFNATEAELEMTGMSDNSGTKAMLDELRNKIIDVGTATGSSSGAATGGTGLNFDFSDLELSFAGGLDINSFLNFGTTSTLTNVRGADLYNSALARCRSAVLNECRAQGVDVSLLTNAYDLEIDKQCISYGRSLEDANDQMQRTLTNAEMVLNNARLIVAQNKNQYDMRGCVTELDNCMQSDYVCGRDYGECLDPSGKYIVNGRVVLGSTPGIPNDYNVSNDGIASQWRYDTCTATGNSDGVCSVWFDPGQLNSYITKNLEEDGTGADGTFPGFLQTKIGYRDSATGRDIGMCIGVLNKCQAYTYDDEGVYIGNNQIVQEWMRRALVQIKSRQDSVLSSYASSCRNDVYNCMRQNQATYSSSDYTTFQSSTATNAALAACRAQITTCASVTGTTPTQFEKTLLGGCPVGQVLNVDGTCSTTAAKCGDANAEIIDGICKCKTTHEYDETKKSCQLISTT
ncbi:MAG: hypothetical protein LBR41_00350 [Rickettsiales bacterium]|nr:hypothetical protein [Rickettsiales bacterium]